MKPEYRQPAGAPRYPSTCSSATAPSSAAHQTAAAIHSPGPTRKKPGQPWASAGGGLLLFVSLRLLLIVEGVKPAADPMAAPGRQRSEAWGARTDALLRRGGAGGGGCG